MSDANPIRVLIVDDHTVVRRGLVFVFQSFDDIESVGEARSIESALRECELKQPDVVLMDMKMATETDGIQATRLIRQRHPEIQVIALTSFHDAQLVKQVIEAGAIGYLLKDVTPQDLAQSIRLAQTGTLTLAPEAAQALLHGKMSPEAETDFSLTDRQLEVLTLLAQGLTNQEIAQNLDVTSHTARHHVSKILNKLNAANRAEAVAIAIQHNLVKR